MEKTFEKSQEQAIILLEILQGVKKLDVEYCEELSKDFINQANRQESLSVLNPSHDLKRNDLLRLQGKALETICKYSSILKEIDLMKKEIENRQIAINAINRMFV